LPGRLFAARQQDDQGISALCKTDSITGPELDTKLRDALAYRLDVAAIAE